MLAGAVSPLPEPGAGAGAGAAATTPVAADVAVAVPRLFTAAMETRSVEPTSSAPSLWLDPVAPPIGTQLAPLEEQRFHWYVNSSATPAQSPGEAERVSPATVLPEIVGSELAEGGAWPGADPPPPAPARPVKTAEAKS